MYYSLSPADSRSCIQFETDEDLLLARSPLPLGPLSSSKSPPVSIPPVGPFAMPTTASAISWRKRRRSPDAASDGTTDVPPTCVHPSCLQKSQRRALSHHHSSYHHPSTGPHSHSHSHSNSHSHSHLTFPCHPTVAPSASSNGKAVPAPSASSHGACCFPTPAATHGSKGPPCFALHDIASGFDPSLLRPPSPCDEPCPIPIACEDDTCDIPGYCSLPDCADNGSSVDDISGIFSDILPCDGYNCAQPDCTDSSCLVNAGLYEPCFEEDCLHTYPGNGAPSYTSGGAFDLENNVTECDDWHCLLAGQAQSTQPAWNGNGFELCNEVHDGFPAWPHFHFLGQSSTAPNDISSPLPGTVAGSTKQDGTNAFNSPVMHAQSEHPTPVPFQPQDFSMLQADSLNLGMPSLRHDDGAQALLDHLGEPPLSKSRPTPIDTTPKEMSPSNLPTPALTTSAFSVSESSPATTATADAHQCNWVSDPADPTGSICTLTFPTAALLQRHFESAHTSQLSGSYHCQRLGCERYLGRDFRQRGKLNRHLLVHSGYCEHVCDLCGKAHGTKEQLKNHYTTHTKEKPYVCQFCGQRSATATQHKNHERTHTKEKPFVCRVCGHRSGDVSFSFLYSVDMGC